MSELLTGCRFYFEADGIQEKMIIEVSGLSAESPSAGGEGVVAAGKNGIFMRQATPTTVKFTKITVKLVATTDLDLYDWYEMCNKNDGGASDWAQNRKAASISAYDQAGEMKGRWEIVNSYPSKYTGPSFSATSTDLANETLELVHEGIKRVPPS